MKRKFLIPAIALLGAAGILWLSCNSNNSDTSDKLGNVAANLPFINNNGHVPDSSQYSGTLFTLSHNYPTTILPVENPIWQQALNGQPISSSNAIAYVDSLKSYVSASMRNFLYNYNSWNAANEGWYSEPWTGSIRDAILGTYVGSTFPGGTFVNQSQSMTTHVLTFYDAHAANTLYNIWGTTAMTPTLTTAAGQFAEGSVIVKFAFTSALPTDWSEMDSTVLMPMYAKQADGTWAVQQVALMQFDIIVKDSKTSPKTGWVFTTLVYDKNAPGNDAWDRMVPLGAMWGNDPESTDTTIALKENVINPAAPYYSKQTLGWNNRLSGPNDGAVSAATIIGVPNSYQANMQMSSCMSCHGPAQHQFESFLLPGPMNQQGDTLQVYQPGSAEWMRWFQDRPGTEPQDSGQIALDYDMVTAFKSLRYWAAATKVSNKAGQLAADAFDKHRGQLKETYNGK